MQEFSLMGKKDLLRLHIRLRYGGVPCPHCGKIIEGNEPDLTYSGGGQYNTEYGVAAHPGCFYIYEASDEWRTAHPEFAPKSNIDDQPTTTGCDE